ncbi:DNA methyltransferase 1-associated protein 1 [Caerostris extrusa]|uniref:DNA methyltransferase 1-associated protein 1 n=1 Tax=Caerostris extrusa TaxID=172846 RepID=A0AAV4NF35_CAEEX|nr:DNA methyltransferase 1-associated protein 1 [Caerostris extrusa]
MAEKKKEKLSEATFKRPEGMHRELYALLYSDNKDKPPMFITDSGQGYKQNKAKLGLKRVRPWKWMPFTNPARKDGAIFHHWRRIEDENEEYPFAKFNKSVQIPSYNDDEYIQHLQCEGWTRQETDHLFDLCQRFDLRFIIIQDRWDRSQFTNRSIEDLKERYYNICNILQKIKYPQSCCATHQPIQITYTLSFLKLKTPLFPQTKPVTIDAAGGSMWNFCSRRLLSPLTDAQLNK